MTIDPELMAGLGAAVSIFLTATGSAIASAEAGVYCVQRRGSTAFLPIVIAGVLAIYGIIVGVICTGNIDKDLSTTDGYRNFSAGLSVGLACLASGCGMAKFLKHQNSSSKPFVDDKAPATQPFIGLEDRFKVLESAGLMSHQTMVMVFLEAIALYGLIVALCLLG